MVHIYTDGSSRGNPGPGGYGVVVMNEAEDRIFATFDGTAAHTTNNRMELQAIITAINKYLENTPNETAIIYTDSSYAEKSINQWMNNWYFNDWKNSKGKTIENLDLIFTLHKYYNKDFIRWQVVKINGHAGIVGNELANALATGDTKKFKRILAERL